MREINNKKKPHLVGRERILRQYERGKQATNCHILYPLGNDSTMIEVFHTIMQIFFALPDELPLNSGRKKHLTCSISNTYKYIALSLRNRLLAVLSTVLQSNKTFLYLKFPFFNCLNILK